MKRDFEAREAPFRNHRPAEKDGPEPVRGGAPLTRVPADGQTMGGRVQGSSEESSTSGRKPELTEADRERLEGFLWKSGGVGF